MANIRVTIPHDGRAQFSRDLRQAIARTLQELGDACLEEANRTIPLEEGIMQDSGFVEVDETALEAQVAYSTPYAVKQHEDDTLTHDPGREDHWLENTVDRNREEYARYMADSVRRKL